VKKNLKSIDLHLIANLILSVIVLIMGIVIMIFKAFGLTDIILYVSVLFYIYAFFGIIAYFVKRREGDYELLLLSLINIVVATYMFVFQNDNLPMILGSAMTVYTILIVANRGYKVLLQKSQNNFVWVIKFIMTFLLAFIGILTTINLFNETTVQTMMMGYYFIITGVLMTIESSIELFMTDRAFNKIVSKLVDDEETHLEEVNEIKEEPVIVAKVEKKKTTEKPKKVETKISEKKSVKKDDKKSVTKSEEKKVVTPSKKSTNAKSSTKDKKSDLVKKAGRPKKEAAMKESKKSEIKIVEKKKTEPKAKKEVKVTKSSASKAKTSKAIKETSTKKPTKKETTKKTTTKKVTKETTKKPGRPKKESSK